MQQRCHICKIKCKNILHILCIYNVRIIYMYMYICCTLCANSIHTVQIMYTYYSNLLCAHNLYTILDCVMYIQRIMYTCICTGCTNNVQVYVTWTYICSRNVYLYVICAYVSVLCSHNMQHTTTYSGCVCNIHYMWAYARNYVPIMCRHENCQIIEGECVYGICN